ncbi:MAG: hypothetical protein PHE15_02805 [Dehalococcoidales bacterium]|nr:hypothetical protein [Dehalococcoidales bacterium]
MLRNPIRVEAPWEPTESEAKAIIDSWLAKGITYFPNPYCEVCRGAGYVHPRKSDGEPDYAQIVMCGAPGCLKESKEKNQ